ncbi:MAG: nicotinate-nucleotide--dimethylbenzimidazole phosphoribosyltransferase [Alphaproteobacteria bacterium]|nr:nicotinate-nucleotide--dimethylbenzimidazole phosphoribosyltransferase [Alphaproteobacteria bacterium]
MAAAARARLDALAKPQGALGRLEDLAIRLCLAAGTLAPQTRPRRLVVFAADHGAVASGVSLWPQAVSRAVAATVLAGRAGCSVLARSTDTAVTVVDCGLATEPLPPGAPLQAARVRPGTRDMTAEPALTVPEFDAALEVGRAAAADAVAEGARLLVAGDIGIGNTTAAAAITALLCGCGTEEVIGPGAGANDTVLAAKHRTVAAAVARARGLGGKAAMAAVSGLEIAGMAGFYLEAAVRQVPVVLDGAISGAAALIAQALEPHAVDRMIASHRSPEPAHGHALRRLGLEPFLAWGMRLGEGTGALALLPQLDMAAALMTEMATLDEALGLAHG